MASRYGFDEAKIARFHKEARGEGFGFEYKPWLTVRDVPSRGRSHRLSGRVTGQIHHLLSDIERGAFLIYDFRDDVQDIREQFPLDLDRTQYIAEAAGIRHPVDRGSRVALVQTTEPRRICQRLHLLRRGSVMSTTTNKLSPEGLERAARVVLDHERQHRSRWQAVRSVAATIGRSC